MVKIENIKNKSLKERLTKVRSSRDALILEVSPKSNPQAVAKRVNDFFVTFPHGQVLLLSRIKYVKNRGSFDYKKEFEVLESLGKGYVKKNKKVNTVRIGAFLEDEKNYLNSLIINIKQGKKIYFNDGDSFKYFISMSDAVRAIEKILNTEVSGKIFNITLNKISEKDIVSRLIEHYEFNFEPLEDYRDKFSEKILDLEANKLISFKPQKTISDYIKTTINKEFKEKPKRKKRFALKFSTPNVNIKTGAHHAFSAIKTTVVALIFVGFLGALDLGLDNYYLYKGIKERDLDTAIMYSNKLRNIPFPTKFGTNYTRVYNSLYYGLNAINILDKELKEKGKLENDTLASVMGISTKAINYVETVNPDHFLTPFEKNIFINNVELIEGLDNKTKYLDLLTLYPSIKEEQTVLVLLQNSNELRPSGGFIGSYALVKTKNLEISEYKFDDIYNIDGTLLEKHADILLELPNEYIDFIDTEYLFARDANLLIDSHKRNDVVKTYFENTLDTEIDYIVYFNLNSMKRLLSLTGPIKLATYNEEITADNFDTIAQTQSEKNYYEGSTQKKNFLTLLGNKVLEELTTDKKISADLILNMLETLENKEVVLYAQDAGYQEIIENLELDGNIINREKNKDYLYIIENNLGENKVNKKTEKKVELEVSYDQRRGIKSNDLYVTLSNFSNNYNWPYGDYEGYLHVGIPESHFVTRVKIKQLDTSKEIDVTRNIQVKRVNNVNVIYIPFSVKPLEEIFVTLSYETKDPAFLDTLYKLKVQKQPGAKDYELKVSLNVPDYKYIERDNIVDRDLSITLN